MFGNNPTRKVDHGHGVVLTLQDTPFLTIQGEGPHAGLPATFVRLWGCHLRCYFCDTDFESNPKATHIGEIVEACKGTELVVITGGEPFRQNIAPLCSALYERGHRVQVETAGNLWFPATYFPKVPDIVVSPKGPTTHDAIRRHATAWKYIVSVDTVLREADGLPDSSTQDRHDKRGLARPLEGTDKHRIYLQPMDEQNAERNAANRARCVEVAQHYGYRVSLQLHKILGVP